ncbi:MAG TPA: tetratricopeptide repeat protein [Verrucomicrobiae bacterium]|nr:tetratricopeptide repeat protein [Verrucomicrobiae bacterium]
MTKTKLITIILASIIFLVAVIGIPLYLEQQKEIKDNEARKQERQTGIQGSNPDVYNRLVESVAKNREVVKTDPNNYNAWTDLGTDLQNLGDYMEAKKAYNQALKISEVAFIPLNNLATIYEEEGKYDLAEKYLLKITEKIPGETMAYLRLAQLYAQEKAGTKQDAVKILEKGIQVTGGAGGLREALQRFQLTGVL